METHGENVNWEQMQWVVTTILGGFSVIYGAILTYIFKELERLHTKDDSIVEMVLRQTAMTDERFRSSVDYLREKMNSVASKEEMQALRQAIEDDRKSAARDRENIAVMMATKDGMQTQLDRFANRILDAVDKRMGKGTGT